VVILTKGRNSQYRFDQLLADTDISGLKFLKSKYIKDLAEYRRNHRISENPMEYRRMQQRLKMITEEIKLRETLTRVRYESEVFMNGNEVIVRNPDGSEKRFTVKMYDDMIETQEIE